MKYSKELLQKAVLESTSYAGVIRYLGLAQAGGTHCHLKKCISRYKIDVSHFTGKVWNKGKKFNTSFDLSKIFVVSSKDFRTKTSTLKKALLLSGVSYCCAICSNPGSHFGQELVLQIDHVDGNPFNNKQDNLRFLCPNCHSQQPTFSRRKNRAYANSATVT